MQLRFDLNRNERFVMFCTERIHLPGPLAQATMKIVFPAGNEFNSRGQRPGQRPRYNPETRPTLKGWYLIPRERTSQCLKLSLAYSFISFSQARIPVYIITPDVEPERTYTGENKRIDRPSTIVGYHRTADRTCYQPIGG